MVRIRLGVNLDHVATLRQARRGMEPDPVHAAVLVEKAGADQITLHLREDRRHIQEHDVKRIREVVHLPLNLEMAPTQEMVRFALEVRPDQVTLVPERREELTTEGGLMLTRLRRSLPPLLRLLEESGIAVCAFVDPSPEEIKEAHRLGIKRVELHTGSYSLSQGKELEKHLKSLRESAHLAGKLGMAVHAGHGLNRRNLRPILEIPEVEEVNIGHSIVSRAIFVGIEEAVREILEIIREVEKVRTRP